MSDVFLHSQSTLADRLVLIALADIADDDGVTRNSPSVEEIALKARISRAQTYRCIQSLIDKNELQKVTEGGHGTGTRSSYRVVVLGSQIENLGSQIETESQIETLETAKSTGDTSSLENNDLPRPKKRRSRAPSTFPLTDFLRRWAQNVGFTGDLEWETQRFLDYHRSKGSLFLDWTAAWRTWIRNSVEWSRPAKSEVEHPEVPEWMR